MNVDVVSLLMAALVVCCGVRALGGGVYTSKGVLVVLQRFIYTSQEYVERYMNACGGKYVMAIILKWLNKKLNQPLYINWSDLLEEHQKYTIYQSVNNKFNSNICSVFVLISIKF